MYRSFVHLTVKATLKSTDFWQSYREKQVGYFLWPTVYYSSVSVCHKPVFYQNSWIIVTQPMYTIAWRL